MTDHLVEEVALALLRHEFGEELSFANFNQGFRQRFLAKAIVAVQRVRHLDCLNERAFDLLRTEGQYEATRPERYRFKAEAGE